MGLRTKDQGIFVQMFAHRGKWLAYPEFIPELVELLNQDNLERRYVVECLKLIDPGEVAAKLREGFIRNYFSPGLLEAYELGADLGVKEAEPGLNNRLKSELRMSELAVIPVSS